MPIKPDQKNALIVAGVTVVVLVLITYFSGGHFGFVDNTNYSELHQQELAQQKAYQDYLNSIQSDPVAGKDLFQQLITNDEVQQQIEAELQTGQKITPPSLADSQINIKTGAGKDQMLGYFTTVTNRVTDYNISNLNTSKNLFNADQDPGQIAKSIQDTQKLIADLKQTEVPDQLAKFHKAQILAFNGYLDVLNLAKSYNLGEVQEPWPALYKDYAVINDQMSTVVSETKRVDDAYHLSDKQGPANSGSAAAPAGPLGLIKPAQAQFNVVVVGNVPDAIREAIKQGLASAFASFATKFLDKLLTKIQNDIAIGNFFAYSRTLSNGQYIGDALNSYVKDPVDQNIVKRLIPALNCGKNNQDLQKIFTAKAYQYLGFDPDKVDPKDPQFYQKMSQAGKFLASPQGQEMYYQDLASKAQSDAQQAANLEILSPGLKSVRDRVTGQITASLSSINNAQAAAYVAILNLGVVNVENVVSKIVSSVVTNLFNKFVFTGVVYKENIACILVPQLTPIVPVSATSYENTGATTTGGK